ncbi:MAG: iron-sulfur cluster assembly protein [Rickettsiales bacterium]|jgi:FeS assembly SUF system protein|nr:iron-sulfur cluster assembly protein [Rickettsiales bacterium]
MKDKIIAALKTVYDPEIPVNIYDLGLVYDIDITKNEKRKTKNDSYLVKITMTFTSPTCPMMEEIFEQVKAAVADVPGVDDVKIELVWDPPWDISRMSDVARLELDLTEQGW